MAKKVLRITSARPGFIRGGHPHPATPTDYALDFFNKKQLEAIRAEPQLTVEEVDADQAAVIINGATAAPVAPLASLALDIPIGPEARVNLGAVVGIALVEAKLSNEAWNALSDDERGEHLQRALDRFVADERARLDQTKKPEITEQQLREVIERMNADHAAALAELREQAEIDKEAAVAQAFEMAAAEKEAAVAEALKATDEKETGGKAKSAAGKK